jgi:hypothetical protein
MVPRDMIPAKARAVTFENVFFIAILSSLLILKTL